MISRWAWRCRMVREKERHSTDPASEMLVRETRQLVADSKRMAQLSFLEAAQATEQVIATYKMIVESRELLEAAPRRVGGGRWIAP